MELETNSKKRLRLSKGNGDDRDGKNEAATETPCLTYSLLQVLVDNDNLSVRDLGNLALTSKTIYREVNKDGIWVSLCNLHYPCTKDLPRSVFERADHRWLYKQWREPAKDEFFKIDSEDPYPMSPPSCRLQDLSMFAHITCEGKVVASFSLDEDKLEELLVEKGEIVCNLPESSSDWIYGRTHGSPSKETVDFVVKLYVFRYTDMTMCCVFDEPGRYDEETIGEVIDIGDSAFTQFPYRKTPLASEILSRLRNDSVNFEVGLPLGDHHLAESKIACTIRTMVLTPNVDYGYREFTSRHKPKDSGLTFLHILSEVDGNAFEEQKGLYHTLE